MNETPFQAPEPGVLAVERFTARELEITKSVTTGAGNEAIAETHRISGKTEGK